MPLAPAQVELQPSCSSPSPCLPRLAAFGLDRLRRREAPSRTSTSVDPTIESCRQNRDRAVPVPRDLIMAARGSQGKVRVPHGKLASRKKWAAHSIPRCTSVHSMSQRCAWTSAQRLLTAIHLREVVEPQLAPATGRARRSHEPASSAPPEAFASHSSPQWLA